MRVLFGMGGPNIMCGPNVWMTRHLPRLRNYGIEPRVLYMAHDITQPCRFRDALEASGIGTRAMVGFTRYMEQDVLNMLEAVAAEAPDIFVPNVLIPGYYITKVLRQNGIKTIGVLHSDDPYYHDFVDVCMRGPEPWRLDAVVPVSAYLDEVARAAATPSTRVWRATYGVPIEDACATPPGDALRLMYIGRLVEWQKRIIRLTHRVCDVTAAVPGVEAILYGDGPKRAEVDAIIASRGATRVVTAGEIAPEQVMPVARQGHALVLLSDFEGLSIALAEAMACGVVPIVSPMRSGIEDLIQHDVNALVVDPEDSDSMIAAVRRLREEPGLWQQLSAAARQSIVSGGFTSDESARRWAGLCCELMNGQTVRTSARIEVPPVEDLELPPRSSRPDGIAPWDRRDPRPALARAHAAGRPIYLWGAGAGGRAFLACRREHGVNVAGVIDGRSSAPGGSLDGTPIYPCSHLTERAARGPRPFVVIASVHLDEIATGLTQLGFEPLADFVEAYAAHRGVM
jgi:colanic acid/amylovoran biosynthesis glycosyltransferase